MIAPQATYALTQRCILRKLLLTPLSPEVHSGLMYLFGYWLMKLGGVLHHVVIMPNHIHAIVTMERANLPAFKGHFYREASKFVKVALAEHGYEAPEGVFTEGRGHHMRLVNAAAQLVWLHYEDTNPISAGLVSTIDRYPGYVSPLALLKGGSAQFRRPPYYCDSKRMPSELEVETIWCSKLARASMGELPGREMMHSQDCPEAFSCGTRPARTKDDLPTPDGPTMAISGCVAMR